MHPKQRAQETRKVRVQCLRGMRSSCDKYKDRTGRTVLELICVTIYLTVDVFQTLGFIKGLIIDLRMLQSE